MSRLTLLLLLMIGFGALQAQSLEELKSQKADKEAMLAKEQAEADAIKADVDALADQILKLSGWQKGINGLVGFDFNKSDNWASSPNPVSRSSALNIGITGFANKVTDGYFWNNKGIITKSWQDVDLSEVDQEKENDGLFDNGTVDILNISSLYGKKLTDKFAISALGELNSSVENFLEPGTVDIGVGGTWTPIQNLVVVIHPLNYHIAFPKDGDASSEGALGAKIRADYTHTFPKGISWSSTFTTFVPYSDIEPNSLFEYTWLNTLSFEVWKGIGVGVSLGLRNAEFEFDGTQSYYTVGLSYSL